MYQVSSDEERGSEVSSLFSSGGRNMKKIRFALVALAGLGLAGCQQDNEVDANIKQLGYTGDASKGQEIPRSQTSDAYQNQFKQQQDAMHKAYGGGGGQAGAPASK
jgi:hypothetical protein